MADLADIIEFLDRELKTSSIADYPGAMNGLQLANEGHVTRIVAAVDASLPVIQAAADGGPALLIVHHGMFWQGARPITGAFYRKLRTAIEAGLAIYSSHLPLDVHPEWGNNILLARALGMVNLEPFFEQKGLNLGLRGDLDVSRAELAAKLEAALEGPVHVCGAGPERVRQVGIITGGAGSEVAKVATYGIDTFVTGEGPHWSFPLAEELELNLLYGGHYATETFGVRKLAEVLEQEFDLRWKFVDRPTGL